MIKPEFIKQKVMLKVVYALIPVAAAGIYFFGWRVAAILLISTAAALITEWIMTSNRKGKISQACFVTSILYGLSLPPTTPFWVVATGAVIAILFGKEVFGGFGRNIFNPAIVGRAFVYVAFPVEMTSKFVPVFSGFPGGFKEWSFETSSYAAALAEKSGISQSDIITAATPMWSRRDFGFTADSINLLFGNIGEVFKSGEHTRVLSAGSIGEVSAIVIILSGIYLLWTKTAQWRLTASTIAGALFLSILLHYVFKIDAVPAADFTLFSGALLFAAVFMVTDPISAPKNQTSQIIYGFFIGTLIVFFRYRSIFAGGVAFSILFGNMAAPMLDRWVTAYKKSKKQKGSA